LKSGMGCNSIPWRLVYSSFDKGNPRRSEGEIYVRRRLLQATVLVGAEGITGLGIRAPLKHKHPPFCSL
jgi:hypothetical protein